MADRTPEARDTEILPTYLRYQFAWEEILDGIRPLGLPMSNTSVRKGLVTKLYKVTLDLPVTLKAIRVRQVSNLVEHPVAVVHARGCCRPLLMTSPPAPPLQNAHHVSLPIAPPVPATHVHAPAPDAVVNVSDRLLVSKVRYCARLRAPEKLATASAGTEPLNWPRASLAARRDEV
jgi:hypothetical protein